MSILIGDQEYFKGIGKVAYEGPESDNPLAYRWYDENRIIAGKTMKEHLRFAVAYWHSFCGTGVDPFGGPTLFFPWDKKADAVARAKDKADAAFEFITKLGLPYYCFHDVDVVDYTNDVNANEGRLQELTAYLSEKQKASGTKLLWGTANLFSHHRYMNGAATNPDFNVVAHAGAQIKMAMDATIALGGENYVFWGGREGYMSLLNTNMKREQEHLAQMLKMAVSYGRANGFKGKFFIEPKPCEPTKHQYDFDAATVSGFLRQHDLLDDFSLNLEVNHATLAGHTFEHELQVAADAGILGSIDANRGDYQNGWDTDQFPIDLTEWTKSMLIILEAGGLQGGINFDAKVRRNSTDTEDLFHAHIGGVDTVARALVIADAIRTHGEYDKIRTDRYASFDSGKGSEFEKGALSLENLFELAAANGEPATLSGRQEYLENMINRFI
ncbi:xylose isomerase [Dyadobacter jejuensis]|uniref:Xylose isomerase n=1 Tax=Dyadobacter jejuensis TaxID=1082580 RepID=A0A316AP75_9BACT|nr:xylose isomerase [Dyadobacter jejuensis]PWJ59372.1 xylose isomerase [Dyadobacter jejuensis]